MRTLCCFCKHEQTEGNELPACVVINPSDNTRNDSCKTMTNDRARNELMNNNNNNNNNNINNNSSTIPKNQRFDEMFQDNKNTGESNLEKDLVYEDKL